MGQWIEDSSKSVTVNTKGENKPNISQYIVIIAVIAIVVYYLWRKENVH